MSPPPSMLRAHRRDRDLLETEIAQIQVLPLEVIFSVGSLQGGMRLRPRPRWQELLKAIPDFLLCHARLSSNSQPGCSLLYRIMRHWVLFKAADLWSKLSKEIWLASSLGSCRMGLGVFLLQKCRHNWSSWSSKGFFLIVSIFWEFFFFKDQTNKTQTLKELFFDIFFASVHGSELHLVVFTTLLTRGIARTSFKQTSEKKKSIPK